MDKDESYDTFDLSTGIWEDTKSPQFKDFEKHYQVYEAERLIVTRLLHQLFNAEEKSRD